MDDPHDPVQLPYRLPLAGEELQRDPDEPSRAGDIVWAIVGIGVGVALLIFLL